MHVVISWYGPKKEPIMPLTDTERQMSSIETHTKETLMSRIGWLLKSAAKKKSDPVAKKE